MSSLKKNIGLQMFYRILAIVTPLITSPIISRALGADKIGVYSATQAFANYFMLFAMLGVEYYGQRSIANTHSREEKSETFWGIYSIQLCASLISVTVYYLSAFFWNPARITVMLIQGLWVISCLFDINWFYFGVEDFKATVTRNFIVKAVTVACIVAFIRTPSDLNLYVAIMAGSTAISQLAMWCRIGQYVDFKRVTAKQCKKHIVPIVRLFVPMIALSIYHFMDKTMLDALSTEAEVGYYYAADKIIYIPLGLITAIGTVMLPRVSSVITHSKDKTEELLNKSSELSICLSCAVGFGIAAIAEEFVPFFFGEGYEKCSTLLLLFAPVLFIKALSNVVDQQYLIPAKLDNQYTIAVTGGAMMNLLCNWLLIPKLGSVGATIGTFIAELTVLIISVYFAKKNINFIRMFLKHSYYLLFGLLMFIAVRFFDGCFSLSSKILQLFLMIMLGGCVYCLLCLIPWLLVKDRSVFGEIIVSLQKRRRVKNEHDKEKNR